VPVVWKEDTVVFVRDRVWVERTALGIAGGQNKVVEAVQDEASPTALFFCGCFLLTTPNEIFAHTLRFVALVLRWG
jgi:hypothetical protein